MNNQMADAPPIMVGQAFVNVGNHTPYIITRDDRNRVFDFLTSIINEHVLQQHNQMEAHGTTSTAPLLDHFINVTNELLDLFKRVSSQTIIANETAQAATYVRTPPIPGSDPLERAQEVIVYYELVQAVRQHLKHLGLANHVRNTYRRKLGTLQRQMTVNKAIILGLGSINNFDRGRSWSPIWHVAMFLELLDAFQNTPIRIAPQLSVYAEKKTSHFTPVDIVALRRLGIEVCSHEETQRLDTADSVVFAPSMDQAVGVGKLLKDKVEPVVYVGNDMLKLIDRVGELGAALIYNAFADLKDGKDAYTRFFADKRKLDLALEERFGIVPQRDLLDVFIRKV